MLLLIPARVLMVWIYNNAGKSMFAMALTHLAFGLFWTLWPVENLRHACVQSEQHELTQPYSNGKHV